MVFTMKTLLQAGLNGRVSVLTEKRFPINLNTGIGFSATLLIMSGNQKQMVGIFLAGMTLNIALLVAAKRLTGVNGSIA